MKKIAMISTTLMIAIILISGCVNNQQPQIKELHVFEKDGVQYIFENNIYDSLNMTMQNESDIKNYTKNAQAIAVIFNGSSITDNAYFTTAAFNFVEKLNKYFQYSQGRFMKFYTYDINNITAGTMPHGQVIYLKGPDTGAKNNSVYLEDACTKFVSQNQETIFNRCIIIQGLDYKNFSMAADRFTLSVIDFNLDQVQEVTA